MKYRRIADGAEEGEYCFVNATHSYSSRFGGASRTTQTLEESFHMPMTAKKKKTKAKRAKKRTVRKAGARGAARKTKTKTKAKAKRKAGKRKTAKRKTKRAKKAAAPVMPM